MEKEDEPSHVAVYNKKVLSSYRYLNLNEDIPRYTFDNEGKLLKIEHKGILEKTKGSKVSVKIRVKGISDIQVINKAPPTPKAHVLVNEELIMLEPESIRTDSMMRKK